MSAAERARIAHENAQAASDPRDKAAWQAAAKTWETLARPATVAFSLRPLERELRTLKRDVTMAAGPFQAPAPKAAPEPVGESDQDRRNIREYLTRNGITF